MRLSELLDPSAVTFDLAGLDKWAVIERLTDLLVESGRLPAALRDRTVEALVARERSMSTGMENGVAIPHCSVEWVEDTLISLGICREGIDFESIDGRPTHIVLLLVTPRQRTKTHIRTLAEIAKLLNDERFRRGLLEAADPTAVVETVKRREAEQPGA